MMQKLRTWILANKIAAFVVAMHLLLIVGFQSGMDRTKSASSMGDTVVANLLDANPQKEKSTVARPTPVKPVEKKKPEPTPAPITTTTGSFTAPSQESSLPVTASITQLTAFNQKRNSDYKNHLLAKKLSGNIKRKIVVAYASKIGSNSV
jgi:hypothetical protein